jgi:hypothetical protein
MPIPNPGVSASDTTRAFSAAMERSEIVQNVRNVLDTTFLANLENVLPHNFQASKHDIK